MLWFRVASVMMSVRVDGTRVACQEAIGGFVRMFGLSGGGSCLVESVASQDVFTKRNVSCLFAL